MTGEHEAVAAVAAAIEAEAPFPIDEICSRGLARAAIAAYQHHLATRSSDAVKQVIFRYGEAYFYKLAGDPTTGETDERILSEYEAAEQSLLALIAEHARGPVVNFMDEMVQPVDCDEPMSPIDFAIAVFSSASHQHGRRVVEFGPGTDEVIESFRERNAAERGLRMAIAKSHIPTNDMVERAVSYWRSHYATSGWPGLSLDVAMQNVLEAALATPVAQEEG